MNNPATLNFFCILFIIIGLFSAFTGLRRIREARARGQHIKWYSQINVLLGIEYVLLALVFLTSTSIRSKSFPVLSATPSQQAHSWHFPLCIVTPEQAQLPLEQAHKTNLCIAHYIINRLRSQEQVFDLS